MFAAAAGRPRKAGKRPARKGFSMPKVGRRWKPMRIALAT